MEYITHSEHETEELGCRFAGPLPGGTVVAMYGDLGAGKTVFARGFAAALGIDEPVSSPTYTILQEYPTPDGHWLYHLDLYRIGDSRAALAFGADEYLESGEYVLVEWPERIEDLLPEHTLRLRIEHLGEHERRWTVCK